MTALKIDSKLATAANEALAPHAAALFARLGCMASVSPAALFDR